MKWMSTYLWVGVSLALGCGANQQGQCRLGDPQACGNGQFCEAFSDTSGMHTACFAPTLLGGRITNAQTGAGVQGARVLAIDGDSHAATGAVALTDASGSYSVRVSGTRTAGASKAFLLRVSAAGYREFPGGIRTALPIAVSFVSPTGAATIAGPEDVALTPMASPPVGSIAGTVSGAQVAGVLVVAEANGGAYSTVSDANGKYVLFNVADGAYTVRGYFIGVNFGAVPNVQVAGAAVGGVNLSSTGPASGALTGVLNYVAGADTAITTTVVLRLRSTREVPPGLVTPAANGTPYRLDQVPDGSYDVLAAFPNDTLVKDPDPTQAGTGTPTATFAGGNTVDVGSFKITDAVNIQGPDANARAAGNPTFSWSAYPQTSYYRIDVFDSQGNTIWAMDNIPRSTSLVYAGPTLVSGGFYQWRITSFAQSTGAPRPISKSEDLRGVWQEQ